MTRDEQQHPLIPFRVFVSIPSWFNCILINLMIRIDADKDKDSPDFKSSNQNLYSGGEGIENKLRMENNKKVNSVQHPPGDKTQMEKF